MITKGFCKNNPVSEAKSGVNWYQKVNDIAKKNDMPYYMVWANFSDTNFYVPYKYSDTMGQEMINEFIDYYNNEDSVFETVRISMEISISTQE